MIIAAATPTTKPMSLSLKFLKLRCSGDGPTGLLTVAVDGSKQAWQLPAPGAGTAADWVAREINLHVSHANTLLEAVSPVSHENTPQ